MKALVMTTVVMGPNVEMGDVQEATQLNEVGERWQLEAAPQHVEILV